MQIDLISLACALTAFQPVFDRQMGLEQKRRQENASELPRRCQNESCRLEVSQIARGEAAPVYSSDRRDHAIGCRHAASLASSSTHNFPIDQRSFFCLTDDAVCETPAPVANPSSSRSAR